MSKAKALAGAIAFATAMAVPAWFVPVSTTAESAHTHTAPATESSGMSGMSHADDASGGSDSAAASTDGTGAAMDWKTMDAQMAKRDKSFPAATKGLGAQVLQPKILADGTKEFHLTTEVVKWEVEPGKVVEAWSYNGTVPGPTLRLKVGDKLRIVLENKLPESTGIHWHGVLLPNAQDGVTNITQDPVPPGATYTYSFIASRQMVAWYHSHHDGTKQVTNGLFGALIIGDLPLPEGVKVSQEIPFELQDAGTIGMTINGKSFPATQQIRARRGEWIEVHYINAGVQSHPMHLHGIDQLVIAKDGFPLAQPYKADTVSVAPGERYTVLVHADAPGRWAWHCHIFPHSEGPQGMFGLFTELLVT
ncbi:copper oxidase [Nonomuraea sp. NPDC048916]|uniref:multicopper oxidase family protein n=1 Tax=Nonomuraea sp. NPDC048916 TaxID=3154232 RepID=UPI0033DAA703